jgi:Arsenical resistance operon protein ArsD
MSVSIQVFDPAMCCSTGICGPSVEPQLIRFAADLKWLVESGVSVERYNLAQQPKAFAESLAAKQALEAKGEAALPLIIVDGVVKSSGVYPLRDELAEWARVAAVPADAPTDNAASMASSKGCCGGSPVTSGDPKKSKCCC